MLKKTAKGDSAANTKKPKESIGFWEIFKVAMGVIGKSCPVYFGTQQLVSIAHGLSHGIIATCTMLFFDSLEKAWRDQGGLGVVLPFFMMYWGIMIASQILNGVHNYMHGVVYNRMHMVASSIIHHKSSKIDPIYYEDPTKLDDINKAQQGAGNLFTFQIVIITLFTFYLPYFVYIAFFLFSVSPLLVLSILFAFIPAMASQILRAKVMAKLEEKAAPIRREYEAYEKSLFDIANMKETRILSAFHYLRALLDNSIDRLNLANRQSKSRAELLNFFLNLVTLLAYGCVIVYAMTLLLDGTISAGAFAAVFTSMGLVFGIMNEIVNQHLGNLSQNFGTIRNYIRFIRLPERSGTQGVMAPLPAIDIKNVSFRYPGAEQDSLSDLNLSIKAGETVAIVGENGAGKSTLVRLITGVYRPAAGTVLVGGLDTATTHPRSLFGSMTGVFQKFQRYKMSLEDNIRLSQAQKDENVTETAARAGLAVDDAALFPQGIHTMLSREFDGVDLSGGGWQRVALARGFYRDHSLILLDEPTAALDPLEESRIYQQFIGLSKGKTAVIVTHRMGSATLANRIVVMDKGKINDVGTHEELLSREGLYAELWRSQAVWYEESHKAEAEISTKGI